MLSIAKLAFLCLALLASCAANTEGSKSAVVIAVGDSITFGVLASWRGDTDYPARLSQCLKTIVHNFGVSGATMQKSGDKPYWDEVAYREALSTAPSIVYLMLGTNDAKYHNWNKTRFKDDALAMVATFRDLQSAPLVYLVSPPPLFGEGILGMSQIVINSVLPTILQEVASESGTNVKYVDAAFKVFGGATLSCRSCMYTHYPDRREGDGCHPVDHGYAQMALALCIATSSTCSCADDVPRSAAFHELRRVAFYQLLILGILSAALLLALGLCLCYCWRHYSRRGHRGYIKNLSVDSVQIGGGEPE